MTADLHALLAHARNVPADDRTVFAERLRRALAPGSVMLETCHRVEVYGNAEISRLRRLAPQGADSVAGEAAARHLLRLAVGRESAVVAEDQVLHQLRMALQQARASGGLAPPLDRLFDTALRAGRRARSWLPARRHSLADVALHRMIGRAVAPAEPVLVVGAGQMGRAAAHALRGRGATLLLTSRTPERAQVLATEMNGRQVDFDPGENVVCSIAGVVVALSGPWPISQPTAAALKTSDAWVIDISAPAALEADIRRALGRRLVSIDDLAVPGGPPASPRLLARLDALVEESLSEYEGWAARERHRAAARALDEKASAARSAELAALWQRMPALEPAQREEVERMARHLTERLLRDPLEQLQADDDGRHARAARELFRL